MDFAVLMDHSGTAHIILLLRTALSDMERSFFHVLNLLRNALRQQF